MKKTITMLFAGFIALQNVSAQNWLTTGNAGLTAANFIGTTDAVPLIFKVNNKFAGRVDYASAKAGTSFGFQTLRVNTGAGNSAFGYQAMFANTYGYANTAGGQLSLRENIDGFSNTAYGSQSLQSNVSGYFNTAVGQASLAGSLGNDNTALGRFAFVSLTTGNGNTALGSAANISDGTLSNVTLLGFYTTATSSNTVQLGNDAVTSVKAANNVVIVSDGRFKKNIKSNVPGLAFINALNPVTYNYNIQALDKFKGIGQSQNAAEKTASDASLQQYAEAVSKKEKILYSGFVAQEVEKAAQKTGYDFSGVYKPQNDKDAYGLSYAEFVVPLVKAVQELSKQDDDLKSENINQQKIIEGLQQQIDALKAAISNQPAAGNQQSNATAVTLTGAALQQNRPNPFGSNTVISYSLPADVKNASLTITTLNGAVVKSIALTGKGNGSITVNAGTLAAGTYTYSLFADGRMTDTKQMVVTK